MRHLVVIALLAFPLSLSAQAATVAPGMSHAQVVAALGEPATSRTASEYTYLFYRNDCGRSCGMNDLVVLRRDSVVDAIFRSSARHYTGTSSSPTAESHEVARARPARAATRPKPVAMPATAKPATPVAAAQPAPVVKPATSVAPAAKPVPAPMVAKPQAAPVLKVKPAGATDTHPSVPAGEPAVRKSPATPAAPAPKPTPTPAP